MDSLIFTIINLVWSEGGCVFGGFVRDILRDDKPNDIDCFFGNNSAATLRFLQKLAMNVGPYKIEGALYEPEYPMIRIMVRGIQIDISPCQYSLPDFDVNLLSLYKGQLSIMRRFDWLTLENTLRNIRRKQARQLPSCPAHRLNKMKEKGWDIFKFDPGDDLDSSILLNL